MSPRRHDSALLLAILTTLTIGACRREQARPPTPPREPAAQPERAPAPTRDPVLKHPDVAARPAVGHAERTVLNAQPAPAAEAELVNGPWADAGVGDEVTYRGAGGTITRKVVSADESAVTLAVVVRMGEQETASQETLARRVPAGQGAASVPATAQWTEADFAVAGKEIRCRVATWQEKRAAGWRSHQLWLSEAVPGKVVRKGTLDAEGRFTVAMEVARFHTSKSPAATPAP